MLTQKDLEQIQTIVQVNIKAAFEDFYENIFEPHVNRSEQHHAEIVREIKAIKWDIKNLHKDTTEIKEYIKDHEKRITALEALLPVKN